MSTKEIFQMINTITALKDILEFLDDFINNALNDDSKKVRFVHYSVKEYLLSQ